MAGTRISIALAAAGGKDGGMRECLFLTASARPRGNALQLAEAAAAALPAEAVRRWIDLAALDLPPFRDLRPKGGPPEGDLAGIHDGLMRATDIVLAVPVYWYALPAPAKLLFDHWSGWLDVPDLAFAARMRGKRMWLITARADPDPEVPAALERAVAQSARWLGMIWGGALHGIGDAPGDVMQDRAAMAAAKTFLRAVT